VLIAAENMLYSYDYKGNFKLLKPLEDRVEIVGSFVVSGGSNEHFSHPVIKDGRLYIRHENSLLVYNISKTDNKIVGSGMPTMLKGRS
jgi:hypothetical protein